MIDWIDSEINKNNCPTTDFDLGYLEALGKAKEKMKYAKNKLIMLLANDRKGDIGTRWTRTDIKEIIQIINNIFNNSLENEEYKNIPDSLKYAIEVMTISDGTLTKLKSYIKYDVIKIVANIIRKCPCSHCNLLLKEIKESLKENRKIYKHKEVK